MSGPLRQRYSIDQTARECLSGHKGGVVWFTGLSGAGKSTLANALEQRLHSLGCRTYVLDGDNLRTGLNADLGFSAQDRRENIRRVGEVSRLMADAGLIVLVALISPYAEDRIKVRHSLPAQRFVEVFCDCPVEVCQRRDVKGLYAKAARGEVQNFTGVSAPYESPTHPELVVNTALKCVDECVDLLLTQLKPWLPNSPPTM